MRPVHSFAVIAVASLATDHLWAAEPPPQVSSEPEEPGLFEGEVPNESSDDVVVGASRRRQTLHEAPAAVSVVTAEQIKRFGWRTLGDILSNVRGLYVSNDRNYSYLGVRGFTRSGDYNSRILLLVNGHAQNEPVYMTALIGREFGIDVDLIERVEIIRGPGSSQYGTSALMGVINVVTKTGPDPRFIDGVGASTTVEADSNARIKGAARLDRWVGRGRVLLSASYDRGGGQSYAFPDLGLTGVTDPADDRDRPLNLFGQLTFGPLSLQAGYNEFQKNTATGAYETTLGESIQTSDRRGFVDGRLQVEPHPDVLVSARGFFNYYGYDGVYPYAEEDGGPTRDGNVDLWAGVESFVDWHPWSGLRFIAGGSVQRYFKVDMAYQTPDGFVVDPHRYWELGGFVDAEVEPFEGLRLTAGARIDQLETIRGKISPRLALVATPLPGTTFKALFSESFRAPNVYELHYEDMYSARGNPSLEPEGLRHYEAIVEQEILDGAGLLTLSFYRDRVTKVIDQTLDDETGFTYYDNTAGATINGLEAEVSGTLPVGGIQATVGYSFAGSLHDEAQAQLVNSPYHLMVARALVPLFKERAHLGLASRYVSARQGFEGRADASSALVFDVTLSADNVLPGIDLGLGASNLLDERWSVPGGLEHRQDLLPQDGRVVWAKLTATL